MISNGAVIQLSEAAMKACIVHWQARAEEYRGQRDAALREIRLLQDALSHRTERSWDGNDYLREIQGTRAMVPLWKRFLRLFWMG